MIKIYTDGSCLENPGNGGWAAIIIDDGKKTQIKGNKENTTNNQMELLAPIEALKKIDTIATENLPWDFWTIDLREAIYKLGELTGEEVTEEIHKRIFSKFCIGK